MIPRLFVLRLRLTNKSTGWNEVDQYELIIVFEWKIAWNRHMSGSGQENQGSKYNRYFNFFNQLFETIDMDIDIEVTKKLRAVKFATL